VDKVSQLLERAKLATSLGNFGADSFRQGLGILVLSVAKDGRLTSRGQDMFDGLIVDLLCWRLKIEQCYRDHPEIDEQEIVAPLIGLGLPRTGSSAFSILLGEDPNARSIRTWEVMAPCPPPETATEHSDPRIERARIGTEQRLQRLPRYRTMVPTTATSPVECQQFMGYDFKSLMFASMAPIHTYTDWLLHEADLVPTYRYLKRILKLLQWRCPPKRWRLKNPAHILFIHALNEVFPDARFWQTHRAVENVIPSVADLYFEIMHDVCPSIDRGELGRFHMDVWELGLRRLIEFRAAPGNDARFFDVEFSEFQKDMVGSVRALYRFLGEPLSQNATDRMDAWRRSTPRDKHGLHSYDAADYKIDIAALRQRFRFYNERFTIPQA
jgi:hypothetical protein